MIPPSDSHLLVGDWYQELRGAEESQKRSHGILLQQLQSEQAFRAVCLKMGDIPQRMGKRWKEKDEPQGLGQLYI